MILIISGPSGLFTFLSQMRRLFKGGAYWSKCGTVKPRLMRTPHYYGQLALSLGKKALTFCLNSTRLIRTPRYYGQFALSLGKKALTFSLNSTRLIRTRL